jgi:hypothetical protein
MREGYDPQMRIEKPMFKLELETTIAQVKEVRPLKSSRKLPDNTVAEERAEPVWHVITSPPNPLCFIIDKQPVIKPGQKALLILAIPDASVG